MKNIYFNSDVLEAEKKIISSLQIPSLVLMENAGKNFTDIFLGNVKLNPEKEIIIFTGKGSNAGDGFVIARHLCSGKRKVRLVMLYSGKELTGDASVNFTILKGSEIFQEFLTIISYKNPAELKRKINFEDSIIIDAVFGVGFKGEPDKRISELFGFLNSLEQKTIVSVDVPSGLCNYNQKTVAVNADITVSMGVLKYHTLFYKGREICGKLKVADIGIPENDFTKYNKERIFLTEKKDVKKFLPVRNINSNKYTSGKVLVITGSRGLTGASYLSCVSAMRTGAGAVIAAVPESVNDILEVKMTEVMTLPLQDTPEGSLAAGSYESIRKKINWADTVLIGPGLSKNEETMELVRMIVKNNYADYVIDADALYAFRDHRSLLKNKNAILTPHYGEFSVLSGIELPELINGFHSIAMDFAKKYNLILALKNSPTVITDGREFYVNSNGRENLATAGSGDVLSGIISGLYSVTGKPFESAYAGVFIHGKCGDLLFEKYGDSSTLAGDLINEIPAAKNKIRED
ncbi:MAG: NAD(P)H-hydrate dehydratase [Bacteroidetes bacterium]|nr:NAD(P)H-hydrate dehydratase [Bacteroidota bacterium]